MNRTIPAGMLTKLQTGVTTIAAFLTLKRLRGATERNVRLNNIGEDVTYDGAIYRGNPGFAFTSLIQYSDGTPTVMDVEIPIADATYPSMDNMREGDYDGGEAYLDLFDWDEPELGIIKITGLRVSDVAYDNTGRAKVTLGGMLDQANDIVPLTISDKCHWELGDEGCGVDIESYAVTSTVSSLQGNRTLTIGASLGDEFIDGTIQFTSGILEGDSYTISHIDGSELRLRSSLRVEPDAGDDVTAYPGCDLLLESGCTFYENQGRHLGFPFHPSDTDIIGKSIENEEADQEYEFE